MERLLALPSGEKRLALTGPGERNLKILRESFGVRIAARDHQLRIIGEDESVMKALHVIEEINQYAERGKTIDRTDVLDIVARVAHEKHEHWQEKAIAGKKTGHGQSGGVEQAGDWQDQAPKLQSGELSVYARGRRVAAMTDGQKAYLEAIANHDLTFCIGPAGTGKTYLAVASVVGMLRAGQVRKLVLVRPAVEAGEKLGFLPGDMQEKVNPYLRPLLDALNDMLDFDQIHRYMASDLIEIIPLAFMRGRTLNDAAIILDEAQNTTKGQMLMFLTRLGHGSKMIVTGDTSQIDLEKPNDSGLIDAARRLRRVPGIAFAGLDKRDIVRHSLVQRVIEAYGDD